MANPNVERGANNHANGMVEGGVSGFGRTDAAPGLPEWFDRSDGEISRWLVYPPKAEWSPEEKLFASVLEQALEQDRDFKDRDWMMAGNVGGVTFNDCCYFLEIDPSWLRKQALEKVQWRKRKDSHSVWRTNHPEKNREYKKKWILMTPEEKRAYRLPLARARRKRLRESNPNIAV